LIYASDNDLALGTAPETVFSSFKNPLEPGRLPDQAAGVSGNSFPARNKKSHREGLPDAPSRQTVGPGGDLNTIHW
jgi:hypothetical protein